MRSECDGNLGLNASPCCACCGIVAGASYMEASLIPHGHTVSITGYDLSFACVTPIFYDTNAYMP